MGRIVSRQTIVLLFVFRILVCAIVQNPKLKCSHRSKECFFVKTTENSNAQRRLLFVVLEHWSILQYRGTWSYMALRWPQQQQQMPLVVGNVRICAGICQTAAYEFTTSVDIVLKRYWSLSMISWIWCLRSDLFFRVDLANVTLFGMYKDTKM